VNADLLAGKPFVLYPIVERLEKSTIRYREKGREISQDVYGNKKMALILTARIVQGPPPRPDHAAAERLKSGIPLALAAGKPGRFKSPFQPEAGEVDLEGLASGTLVKCPYTGNLFRVP
jgi:hypothetical protein